MRLLTVLLAATAACVSAEVRSLDPAAIDRSADPCTDFFQYACGNWLKSNPIPPDQASWGRFHELMERNRSVLKDMLETAAAKPTRTLQEKKLGDYYGACMDETGIEAKGTEPLKPMLAEIASLNDKGDLPNLLGRLHRAGAMAMFRLSSTQDYKNSAEVIAEMDQGGLGLPDRDYYLKDDARSAQLRSKYVQHVQRMFELLGNSSEAAAARAQTVLSIETTLARGAMDRVSRRNPKNTYHRMMVPEFARTLPEFDLPLYLKAVGAPAVDSLNVTAPGFFEVLNKAIAERALSDWQTYLTWHYLRTSAPFLPRAFVDSWFEFYGQALKGQKQQQPRWKRCVQFTDSDLGELLGQIYAEQTFGREGKERTVAMVKALERALEKDIRQISWMTPATKERALEKLNAITDKIGYPEKWRDYTKLRVYAGDALGNSERANAFDLERRLNKIGKPVDKLEWHMTPPTVNAYYDPQNNTINFPAGILQPPFFDREGDEAVNFGAVGAVIGHELTHGFDDEGRKFDAQGNMTDWWTEADGQEFENRASCFVDQYGAYSPVPEVKLNGKLTLGENVADNGGLRIAYMALMDSLDRRTTKKIDGFTPEQRFFLGWGQIWCVADREETARLRALTDPHSPGKYRVNGTLSNMPEFHKAFGCKAGQPMVAANACRVW